jgi:hypothetical protein
MQRQQDQTSDSGQSYNSRRDQKRVGLVFFSLAIASVIGLIALGIYNSQAWYRHGGQTMTPVPPGSAVGDTAPPPPDYSVRDPISELAIPGHVGNSNTQPRNRQ